MIKVKKINSVLYEVNEKMVNATNQGWECNQTLTAEELHALKNFHESENKESIYANK